MKKVAVIGGGISGVSIAKMLNKTHEVVVYEKESTPGGLIRCEDLNGNLYHKIGGHVFNSKNPEVKEWFWKHFNKEKEFRKTKRKAKILIGGKTIGYPIENYLYQLDEEIIERVISDILELNQKEYQSPFSYPNFEAFLKGNFGHTLYNLYFKPYNYKIWKTDLSKVALEWLEGKLPMPNYKETILSNILQKEETDMVHSSFFYAKEGGSQFIINRLAEGLKIECSFPVSSLKFIDSQWVINEDKAFDTVVYTGDVRKIHQLVDIEDSTFKKEADSVKNLQSHGTSNLFCECDETDLSWLYLPDEELKAHRIIYTGNFSESNNRGTGRKTCVVEFSGKITEEEMTKELIRLPGNLKSIKANYEANSYVIQEKDTRKKIQQLKNKLEPNSFFLLGRFAEWEYYNMDKAIEAALDLRSKNGLK